MKEVDRITPHYRAYIEASPFVALATAGPEGLDCSPRGDRPGFVRVHDEKTLMMPDRRGNNRIDSLRNIVRDPRVALLFLIPGVGNTLRVNGRAQLSVEPALLRLLRGRGQAAALGDGDDRRCGLLPVRPRPGALRAVESGAACRSEEPAQRRPDPRGAQRRTASVARPTTASGRAAPPRPCGSAPLTRLDGLNLGTGPQPSQ